MKPIIDHVKPLLEGEPMEETKYLEAATVSVADLQKKLPDLTGMGVKTYATRLERLGLLLATASMADYQGSWYYVPTHLLQELIHLIGEPQARELD